MWEHSLPSSPIWGKDFENSGQQVSKSRQKMIKTPSEHTVVRHFYKVAQKFWNLKYRHKNLLEVMQMQKGGRGGKKREDDKIHGIVSSSPIPRVPRTSSRHFILPVELDEICSFQEAYKMVNEAEERRSKAEKLLAESRLKVSASEYGVGRIQWFFVWMNGSPERRSVLRIRQFSSTYVARGLKIVIYHEYAQHTSPHFTSLEKTLFGLVALIFGHCPMGLWDDAST